MTVADGSGEAAALDDHAVALDVAHRAGEMLVDLIHSPDLDRRWGGLEYEGDARAHRFIMSELRRMRPDDAILSEEGADDRSRVGKERVWIVDPLDGSSDYGYSPHWSVHVALVVDGEPTVGAVAVFTLIAAITVIVPVVGYLIGGERLDSTLDRTKAWLIANNNAVMAVLFLVFSVSLFGDALEILT